MEGRGTQGRLPEDTLGALGHSLARLEEQAKREWGEGGSPSALREVGSTASRPTAVGLAAEKASEHSGGGGMAASGSAALTVSGLEVLEDWLGGAEAGLGSVAWTVSGLEVLGDWLETGLGAGKVSE